MEFEDGAIYADSDGCLLLYDNGAFSAFGTKTRLELANLTGRDRPITKVIGNDGNILVNRLNYPNGTNTRGC